MDCIVTAGPTYEPLDQVRRLINFSTGRLGCELASFLTDRGHNVTLLVGHAATWSGRRVARAIEVFTTTDDLHQRLKALGAASPPARAVFHAAAVSDFRFGKVMSRSDSGALEEIQAGKISTRQGVLMAELLPTPKIIGCLRQWFPSSVLVGWKYEVDGDREQVLSKARLQIDENHTDACVANGPAYGRGFGIVSPTACTHVPLSEDLFAELAKLLI